MNHFHAARALHVVFLIFLLLSCRRSELEKRLTIHKNDIIKLSHPKKILGELLNPTSPIVINNDLVFSESGTGTIYKVENGRTIPLITGFVKDNYAGYDISAQGITVDPNSGAWIVCAAEGPGKVFIYEPNKFPVNASEGHQAELIGATEDNPWEAVVWKDILIVSGGTKKQYMGKLDRINPVSLFPEFSVETGLIGIARHPFRDEIYGAVFGIPPSGGSVIKWSPANSDWKDSVETQFQTLAIGLHNTVDVAITAKGTILALEFGEFNSEKTGRLILIDEKTGRSTNIIEGLNSPSSFTIDERRKKIYISEFGVPGKGKNGNLIVLDFTEDIKR